MEHNVVQSEQGAPFELSATERVSKTNKNANKVTESIFGQINQT